MFGLGPWELAVIAGILVVLFPRRLHGAARGLGECLGLVRKAVDLDEGEDNGT